MVTGMVAGHDPGSFFRWFESLVDEAFVVPIDAPRSLPTQDTAEILRRHVPSVRTVESAATGIDQAVEAAGDSDIVLVTGSFYLVGQVGRHLADTER